MTRAERIVECAINVHKLQESTASGLSLPQQIVACLSESGFLTREALNPPGPTDAEMAAGVEAGLRGDLAE